jgi:hypothetical protein
MRFVLLTLIIGCSASDDTPTPTTTDTGTVVDSAVTDTGVAETAGDASPSCPGTPPKSGDPCPKEGQRCEYAKDCGPSAGDFATCAPGGQWAVISNPCTTGMDTGPG